MGHLHNDKAYASIYMVPTLVAAGADLYRRGRTERTNQGCTSNKNQDPRFTKIPHNVKASGSIIPQDPAQKQNYRIQDAQEPTQNQNVGIQDPHDPMQIQNFRIQDPQDPTGNNSSGSKILQDPVQK